MKIFIDARYIRSTFSGIGVYSENLLHAMGELDHENEYVILIHSSYRGDLNLPGNFHVIQDDARPVSMRTLHGIGKLVRQHDPDIFHSMMPLWPLALYGDYHIVSTVFDLQPLLDPLFTSGRSALRRKAYDLFYQFSYRRCLVHADYLISISFSTKRDIARTIPAAAENVLVVRPGFDSHVTDPATDEQIQLVKEKYDLPERYILYLGSTRPNKNLPRMLDAYEELLRRHPEDKDLRWVMVLRSDRFFDPFFAQLRQKGLLRQVQIFDQVTDLEKRVFYRNAQALYFPTMFEGFGLPVLEAQGNGLPVLASNHSALPEVAGNAAVLVDPQDVISIADGLERILYDQELRATLIENGYKNTSRFSWTDAAREIINAYEHLLK